MENSPSNSNLSEGNHSYRAEYHNQDSDNHEDMGLLRAKYKNSTNKVYHDFYKTKMCSLFNLNICKKGKDCPFAHSEDELRDKPNLQKTKLCDDFLQQGHCHRGENCPFAHGEDELRSTPDLFKTAICNLWTQGKCTAGESCRFAHGYEDLRPAPSHHKFKKKPQMKKPIHKNNHHYGGQNSYYNNQYSGYGSQMYGYPMYSMQMMPEDMQAAYLMNQQFAYNGGLDPQIKKY
jgi:hypothetical protein